jgi:hypothetical protein
MNELDRLIAEQEKDMNSDRVQRDPFNKHSRSIKINSCDPAVLDSIEMKNHSPYGNEAKSDIHKAASAYRE